MVIMINETDRARKKQEMYNELKHLINSTIKDSGFKCHAPYKGYIPSIYIYKNKFGGLFGHILGRNIISIDSGFGGGVYLKLSDDSYLEFAKNLASKIEEEYGKKHNRLVELTYSGKKESEAINQKWLDF